MAWASSEKEIEELERLARQRSQEAEARKQLNDAENRIAVATDQNNVRADKLQLQREAEFDRNQAARERFAKSHAFTAITQPGRYSPQEVKAARDYLEGQGYGQEGERRRQFNEQQATARHEADKKAEGMIGQGREAAQARANADKEIARTKANADENIAYNATRSAREIKDAELAASKELAAMESETKKYGIDAEHGTADREGSLERVARLKTESEVAVAEANRKAKQDALAYQVTQQLGKQASDYTSSYISKMGSIIAKRYEDALTPEQRKAITDELKEQYKDNPVAMAYIGAYDPSSGAPATPMPLSRTQGQTPPRTPPKEGDTKNFPNGDIGTYRNGKWEKTGTWK